MSTKRLFKSLINTIFFIVNMILWIFQIKSLGELATGIKAGKNQREKLIYGLSSMIQYLSYFIFGIGFFITIYWWFKNDLSIAERLSNIKQH